MTSVSAVYGVHKANCRYLCRSLALTTSMLITQPTVPHAAKPDQLGATTILSIAVSLHLSHCESPLARVSRPACNGAGRLLAKGIL